MGDRNRITAGHKSKPVPISQRRAIGNLLRLADACIRDGRLLLHGDRSSNVAMLMGSAATHTVEAVVISERGQMIRSADVGAENLEDENPVEADLVALAALTHQEPPTAFSHPCLRTMRWQGVRTFGA